MSMRTPVWAAPGSGSEKLTWTISLLGEVAMVTALVNSVMASTLALSRPRAFQSRVLMAISMTRWFLNSAIWVSLSCSNGWVLKLGFKGLLTQDLTWMVAVLDQRGRVDLKPAKPRPSPRTPPMRRHHL